MRIYSLFLLSNRYLTHYKKIARVIPRIINPFLSIGATIGEGMQLDISLPFKEQDLTNLKNMLVFILFHFIVLFLIICGHRSELTWREIYVFTEGVMDLFPNLLKVIQLFADDPDTIDALLSDACSQDKGHA